MVVYAQQRSVVAVFTLAMVALVGLVGCEDDDPPADEVDVGQDVSPADDVDDGADVIDDVHEQDVDVDPLPTTTLTEGRSSFSYSNAMTGRFEVRGEARLQGETLLAGDYAFGTYDEDRQRFSLFGIATDPDGETALFAMVVPNYQGETGPFDFAAECLQDYPDPCAFALYVPSASFEPRADLDHWLGSDDDLYVFTGGVLTLSSFSSVPEEDDAANSWGHFFGTARPFDPVEQTTGSTILSIADGAYNIPVVPHGQAVTVQASQAGE